MGKDINASFRKKLIFLAFLLFSIFLIGIFWLTTSPTDTVTLALAYAAGLSMIVLPCTLPLAFVIVPISMSKSPQKGLGMALLFGLGLTITITLYGSLTAVLGGWLGLGTATRVMFFLAGLAAFIFGLSELNLVKFEMPTFGGSAPAFVEKRGDYLKAFLLGLFLGNAGIGCPNPAFYVLLAYIASTASLYQGTLLGFVHGLGRATPLIFLAILGILGVNATQDLVGRRELIDKVMGWSLVVLGAFILAIGLFSMYWWESSFLHEGWNNVVAQFLPAIAEFAGAPSPPPTVLEKYFPWLPPTLMLVLILLPVVWVKFR
ncbi:MAG: cytochrome C biogenesis protein, partial [Candidatus Diapherotrites archaeon]|nr:cytochrome C biogenesis protein [Candidatus Diapherotrites archaeon]